MYYSESKFQGLEFRDEGSEDQGFLK
uniref:Uncharacterized protein n=1 Tax=Anguilla anguilla TaxID=7936 RepID=A0A0E9SB47_ANGAN